MNPVQHPCSAHSPHHQVCKVAVLGVLYNLFQRVALPLVVRRAWQHLLRGWQGQQACSEVVRGGAGQTARQFAALQAGVAMHPTLTQIAAIVDGQHTSSSSEMNCTRT